MFFLIKNAIIAIIAIFNKVFWLGPAQLWQDLFE